MNENTIKFSAVGDIMLCGGVEENIKKYGTEYPFLHVSKILKDSDITFGNLEAPLTNENKEVIWDYTKIIEKSVKIYDKEFSSIFCKGIPGAANGLNYAGFNIVSLGNNHIMDYGVRGLIDTIRALSELKIKYFGIGKNLTEARSPIVIQKKNIKIGFLSYCDVYIAGKTRPGTVPLKYSKEDVIKLKKLVDIIIVSIHQGLDAADYPMPNEIHSMHSIIDSGADLILRHHAHTLQGIEHYKSGIIVYSLGNFVFDYNIDPLWKDLEKTRESMIFQCEISKAGILNTEIIPICINNHYQPEIPSSYIKNKILLRIEKLSFDIMNNKDNVWLNGKQNDFVKTEMALVFHVFINSVKKRKFRNILLILDRIELHHIKLLIKYIEKNIIKSCFK